jgi:hypothetical protein
MRQSCCKIAEYFVQVSFLIKLAATAATGWADLYLSTMNCEPQTACFSQFSA